MLSSANTKTGPAVTALHDDTVKSAGLGQIVTSRHPEETLIAYGLGSCVGIIGYDPVALVGGLLHALLPQREQHAEQRSPKGSPTCQRPTTRHRNSPIKQGYFDYQPAEAGRCVQRGLRQSIPSRR